MALSTSRKYSILAFADDKQTPGGIIPCLNVYETDNSVSNGRNVTVWNDELAISQLWKLLSEGTGKYRIMTLATPPIAGYEVNPLNIPHNDGFVNFAGITSANIISTTIKYETSGIVSDTACLQKIKNFIDANKPAIIRTKNGSSNHFCVAYGYTNGAATKDDILTYDTIYPKDSNGSELTSKYGEVKNLTRVLSLNYMTSFSEVFTYYK